MSLIAWYTRGRMLNDLRYYSVANRNHHDAYRRWWGLERRGSWAPNGAHTAWGDGYARAYWHGVVAVQASRSDAFKHKRITRVD